MKSNERDELVEGFAKANNGLKYKVNQKWKTVCIETKEHPTKPTSLITGEVLFFHPTGDIVFSQITKMQLWNKMEDEITQIQIPDVYKDAKKIVIRREIVAKVIYLEELEEGKEEDNNEG